MNNLELNFLFPIVTNYPFWRFYFVAVVLTMLANAPLSLIMHKLAPRLDAIRILLLVTLIMPFTLALSGYYFNPFSLEPEPKVIHAPVAIKPFPQPGQSQPLTSEQRKIELLRIYRKGINE